MKNYKMESYKATTAFSGVGVFGFIYGIENKVLVADVIDGKPTYAPRPCTVYNNLHGHVYFMHHGRREYLMDYMKTGNW